MNTNIEGGVGRFSALERNSVTDVGSGLEADRCGDWGRVRAMFGDGVLPGAESAFTELPSGRADNSLGKRPKSLKECAPEEYRDDNKAFLRDVSIFPQEAQNSGDEIPGSGPATRQFGNGPGNGFREMEAPAGHDPLALLPHVLSQYAATLAQDRGISPMSAAAAVIAGASTALGKGVHVVTCGERVHANLHILNIGRSGAGKKSFHAPTERATKVLGEIEAACRRNRDLLSKELKVAEKTLEEAKTKGSDSDVFEAEAKVDKLRLLSAPRNLAFGEDASPQVIARSMVEPGQGGACAVNSGEGIMFFSKIAGSSKRDGYGTLLTKGFNDTEYVLSRVDEGRNTHGRALDPRLFLTISAQNTLIPEIVKMMPTALGVFQRFLYVVEEDQAAAPSTRKLFRRDGSVNPFEISFAKFAKAAAEKCWANAGSEIELRFSKAAMDRLEEHSIACETTAHDLSIADPILREFVSRWTEQVIKLVQTFHVANYTNAFTGEIDWAKVNKPISAGILERAIAFHEIWTNHTRRFVELWIKPKGLTLDDVKGAMFKALKHEGMDSHGVDSSSILKYLPKVRSPEFLLVVERHPGEFKITEVGKLGKKLYLPVVTAGSFKLVEKKGGENAA